jgi:hypothetical protein
VPDEAMSDKDYVRAGASFNSHYISNMICINVNEDDSFPVPQPSRSTDGLYQTYRQVLLSIVAARASRTCRLQAPGSSHADPAGRA